MLISKKQIFLIIGICIVSFSLRVSGEEIIIDDFESENVKHGYVWPKDVSISFSNDTRNTKELPKQNKKSLKIDCKNQAGVWVKEICKHLQSSIEPKGITFWLKADKYNKRNKIVVEVKEKNGNERYHKNLKLSPNWRKVKLMFSDLKLVTYGKAKIGDRKLNIDDIVELRFSSYPKGAVFYLDDIKLIPKKQKHASRSNLKKKLNEPLIFEVKLDEKYPDYSDNYPKKVKDIRIEDGNFIRNNKRSFLLGGWQLDHEGPPWYFRTMDLDFYNYNATETYSLSAKKRNGVLQVKWNKWPYYESYMHRMLSNGVLFWHEHKSHPRYNALKKYYPEVVDSGHFVSYDGFNPQGRFFYNQMWKSWMRMTRKYPIFCYELFNETHYYDTHNINRIEFRKRMESKYRKIEVANHIWGTDFSSFSKVEPPGFIGFKPGDKKPAKIEKKQALTYHNLWVDWIKFQETRFGEMVEMLMPEMRGYDKSPRPFTTIQTHGGFFHDRGPNGVNPADIVKVSDFYSHEAGFIIYPQTRSDNPDGIKKMLMRSPLSSDIVRYFCPSKPIVNAEAPVKVSNLSDSLENLLSSSLVNLHRKWLFTDATSAVPEGYFSIDFDDASWGKIDVPSKWGDSGYPQCQTGIYRIHFDLSPEALNKSNQLFLNGNALADRAEVYLNGKLIKTTKNWQATFSLPVKKLLKSKNVLAIKLNNTYFREGMFHGGLRGQLTLNEIPAYVEPAMKPGYYRTHIWSQLVHGLDGVAVCYGPSEFSAGAKILPKVKKEIESVANIVMPKPKFKAKVAFVYPFDTFRGIVHTGYQAMLQAPATSELIDIYGPLLLSGCGVDVITEKDLIKLDLLKQYEALFISCNIRASGKIIETLGNYVKDGGVLVADYNSLTVDDEKHKALNPEKLFGIKINSVQNGDAILKSDLPGLKSVKITKRWLDQLSYANFSLDGADALAQFDKGSDDVSPAISVYKYGKGKSYFVGANLPYEASDKLVKHILSGNNIRPYVELDNVEHPDSPTFVESALIGKDGRYVLYMLNWGKNKKIHVSIPSLPEENYFVRSIRTGKRIKTSSHKNNTWSSDDLNAGVTFTMDSLNPIVWIIEKETLSPTELFNISPKRYAMLNKLWRTDITKAEENNKTVAICSTTGKRTSYTPNTDMPTAVELIHGNNYNIQFVKGNVNDLSDVDILIWSKPRVPVRNPKLILDYVRNGGKLLLCGMGVSDDHSRNSKIMPLLKEFKTKFKWKNILTTDHYMEGDDFMRVPCTDTVKHPITEGVSMFIPGGAGILDSSIPDKQVLIKAPANSNNPGAPMLLLFPYGKGEVVLMPDNWWMRPFGIERGDNAQLLLNIVNYLADKPVKILTESEKNDALYITRKKLEEAESQEKKHITTFKKLKIKAEGFTTSWNDGNYQDPIVDME